MAFSSVFVAGSGLMGSGIAYVAATKANARVVLYDIYPIALERAQSALEKMGKSSVDKGFITQEQLSDAMKRIKISQNEKDAADADLIIEAIAEDLQAKREL